MSETVKVVIAATSPLSVYLPGAATPAPATAIAATPLSAQDTALAVVLDNGDVYVHGRI